MGRTFILGQRWISEREPELGLGTVSQLGPQTVRLLFAAAGEHREYALAGAPLRRVRFQEGERVCHRDGREMVVTQVFETSDLLTYDGSEGAWHEHELNPTLRYNTPRERLLGGQLDDPAAFDLRVEALKYQGRRRKSPVRGFLGARIELLPHQLRIASEVSGRLAPRVLLADEVGLGKTIEAGLILHRLLATGRASRILVLVPEALLPQWFLELLRRFSLWFTLVDAPRLAGDDNPFEEAQLILTSLDVLLPRPERLQQALEAEWDLVIVDEAHHLTWSPDAPSPAYTAVEALGRKSPGLLLLTATPEQLGEAGHHARMRLLDPDRFPSLEAFQAESRGYAEVAALAARLAGPRMPGKADIATLARLLGEPETDMKARLTEARRQLKEDPAALDSLLDAMVDRHGPSRSLFRNTRAAVPGFPGRATHLRPLQGEDPALIRRLVREFEGDLLPHPAHPRLDLGEDPRMDDLAALLRELAPQKVLLICRSQDKAEAIEEALKPRLTVKTALFTEGMTLVQRDRAAAWFADPQGARLMIASEIGGEGRNFQFTQHLVLFDLPLDPSVLDQRIGRLDRLGQRGTVQLHVPFVTGSPQEILVRWCQEGLDAFQGPVPGGHELVARFGDRVRAQALKPGRALATLLRETREARDDVAARLEAGRDRLLEHHASRPALSRALIEAIRTQDEDRGLETFLVQVLDHFGVSADEVAHRTWRLGSTDLLAQAIPGLPAEGVHVTADRARALAHEDLQFLTWDHPLATGALDMMLGSGHGTASFALWPDPEQGLYLELIYVIEALAPAHLHVDRFLAPTPFRLLLDSKGVELGRTLPRSSYFRHLKPGQAQGLLDRPELRQRILPRMVDRGDAMARARVPAHVNRALQELASVLDPEIQRLEALRPHNPAIRPEEIQALREQRQALEGAIQGAEVRLAALRWIVRGI